VRNHIVQLKASNRNCAVVAKSGRMRVSIVEATGLTTGYNGGAKNVRKNTTASVTSGLGKLGEGTSDMKTVIGLLMESKRSYAVSAENGKARMSLIKTGRGKTV
jgi:hypothetical protein